jgi:hypothetical protein
MNNIFNCIYIAGILTVASCSGTDKNETELNADINAVNSIQSDSTSNTANTTNALPIQNQQTQPVTIAPPPITPTTNNTSAIKLNPAHGQPGHDCAIAVGAPLPVNGAAKTINPVQTINPATTIAPAQNISAVKPGMNPAHGQPGHRCDIAVGAPLNSPVSSTTPSITTTPVNGLPAKITVPPITGTPPVPLQTAAVGPGLNPAHGQPGHRCDIAVGAALPKQ